MILWIFFYSIYQEVRPGTPWSVVGDIHKPLWISSNAVPRDTPAANIDFWLSESLSMDHLVLNIKSLGICSDKKDLKQIFGLGKLEKTIETE